MVVLTYGMDNIYRYNKHKLFVFTMSFDFKNTIWIRRSRLESKKMAELRTDLYEEILRYTTQETSYFNQPIDLSSYRDEDFKTAA